MSAQERGRQRDGNFGDDVVLFALEERMRLHVDHDDQTVSVAMTKDQIKSAPDFDQQQRYEERDFDTFGSYYDDYSR